MSGGEQDSLFEIYRIHVELAERVAHLRESINKIHTGMVTGVVAASVWPYRESAVPWSDDTPTLRVVRDVASFVSGRSRDRGPAPHALGRDLYMAIGEWRGVSVLERSAPVPGASTPLADRLGRCGVHGCRRTDGSDAG